MKKWKNHERMETHTTNRTTTKNGNQQTKTDHHNFILQKMELRKIGKMENAQTMHTKHKQWSKTEKNRKK